MSYIRPKAQPFPLLALLTSISIFVMNVIGSYVSASGAGLACPDWPLCPEITSFPIFIEFVHRALAIWVVLLTSLTVIAAARHKSDNPSLNSAKKLAYLALVVLIAQIFLGAVVIYTGLRPEVVALHQAIALTVFALLVASASIAIRYVDGRG